MPTRREILLGLSSMSLVPNSKVTEVVTIRLLLDQLEQLIKMEIPDLKEVMVKYDPEDKKVPLMVVALRV